MCALMKEPRPRFFALETSAAPTPAPASHPSHVFVLKNGGPVESAAEEIDTAVLSLSPDLLRSLRAIAPKKRRSAIPYVFFLAVATVAVSVAGPRSTRELITERWHRGSSTRAAPPEAAPTPLAASPSPIEKPTTVLPAAAAPTPVGLPSSRPRTNGLDHPVRRAGKRPARH
jgi:hypothetical protein